MLLAFDKDQEAHWQTCCVVSLKHEVHDQVATLSSITNAVPLLDCMHVVRAVLRLDQMRTVVSMCACAVQCEDVR